MGERGPELVSLPRHSQVLPAGQTAAALRGGAPPINVYLPTGDPEAAAMAVSNRLVAAGTYG